MNSTKFRFAALMVALLIFAAALTSCVAPPEANTSQGANTDTAVTTPAEPAATPATTTVDTSTPAEPEPAAPAADPLDISVPVTLNLSVFYQDTVKMTYQALDGNNMPQNEYAAADGATYRPGDFKPVWKELQSRLNFTINDVVPADAKNVAGAFTSLQATGFDGVDVMVGNATQLVQEGVMNGTFVALDEYLDIMPNYKAFLDANSIVKTSITSGDGHIYYAPYFDGYDDLERMFIFRADWVKKLLDEDVTLDTGRTVDTYYTPSLPESYNITVQAVKADGSGTQSITKKADKNIITTQNNLSVKNGETLTNALREHIDTVYGNTYKNRSDLFIGQDAAYDADELVALMRCVLANPMLLTGQTERDVVPFFPRWYQAGRLVDLVRLAEIWGVRGLESRLGYLYMDVDGTLKDARFEMETIDAVERLNMLYKEGLILQDFDKKESTEGLNGNDHRARLLNENLGFATYDYNQTTTVLNSNDQKYEGFDFRPVLPPVADWDNNGEYYQFTDSWRSVKSDGWAILSAIKNDDAKLKRALKLFDYQYSAEGNRLMSYGPEAWIDGTMTYGGKEVPKLSAAALNELATLAGGNYTNYYRMWLGATFPIGYVKEQGMEYQTVHPKGQYGLNQILRACELGTMRHLVVDNTKAKTPGDYLMPTTFATTSQEEQLIRDNCADLAKAFGVGNNDTDVIIFTSYIINGFDSVTANGDNLLSKQGLLDYLYKDLNGQTYLEAYRSAYNRMTGQ